MAASARKAPASTRRFGFLRLIAYLHVFLGLLIFIAGVVIAALTLNTPNTMTINGQTFQTSAFGGPAAAASVLVSTLLFALIYVGIGQAILAFLSIEEHVRRSAIAQEQLLRANMQLLRQLDQRLP